MTNLMKIILIALGALAISAPSASAMSPKPGQGCIMWICWDKPNQWKPNYGGRADADTGTVIGETDVAMMTPEMLKAWDATLTRSTTYSSIDLDGGWDSTTQFAFNRRGSTCSPNPYGRRSSYCNEGEVEAPLQSEVTASFGSCLLDDAPLDLEQLVDCRSDACLGRKFYYGSFGKVGR